MRSKRARRRYGDAFDSGRWAALAGRTNTAHRTFDDTERVGYEDGYKQGKRIRDSIIREARNEPIPVEDRPPGIGPWG